MSRKGALIEGESLPATGSQVRLSRGSLTVTGEVLWLAQGRAGLQFAEFVSVPDWLPSAQRNPRQQYVDEVVYHSKLGSQSVAFSAPSRPTCDQPPSSDRLAAELVGIKRSIDRAAEELASDPETSARHAASLQALDLAAQSVGRLTEALASAKS